MSININIKHNEFEKKTVIKENTLIGDFVKDSMNILNIMIYSVGEIKLSYKENGENKISLLGTDISFMSVFDNSILSENDCLDIEFTERERDENGNVIKNDLADIYNSFILYKQDEQFASSMQDRYERYDNYYNNPYTQQVYYIPLNTTNISPPTQNINTSNIDTTEILNSTTLAPISENNENNENNENEENNENNENEENNENPSIHPELQNAFNNIENNITSFMNTELPPLIGSANTFMTNLSSNIPSNSTMSTVQNNIATLLTEAINNSTSLNNINLQQNNSEVQSNDTNSEQTQQPQQPQQSQQPQQPQQTQPTLHDFIRNRNRNRLRNSTALINLFDSIFQLPPQQTAEDVRITGNEEELNELQVVKYKDINEDFCRDNDIIKSTECTICLENFDEEDDIIITKCKHMFHKSCIKKWLIDYSVKCPICKKDIIKGTPNIENNNSENQDNEILEEAD